MASLRTPRLPRKEPRQQRSQALCAAILTSAARVFDELGYEAATTNRIAQVAGVSVGSLYQYFPSKSALITALHEQHTQQVAHLTATHFAHHTNTPPAQWVHVLVRELLALHRLQPRLQLILHGRMPNLKRPAESSQAKASLLEPLLRWLRAHSGQHRTLTDAYLLCQTAEALVHAATLEPPAFATEEELAGGIERSILAVILAR